MRMVSILFSPIDDASALFPSTSIALRYEAFDFGIRDWFDQSFVEAGSDELRRLTGHLRLEHRDQNEAGEARGRAQLTRGFGGATRGGVQDHRARSLATDGRQHVLFA